MADCASGEETIKYGILIKRSVVKRKKFASQNYKTRYFELTKKALNYYYYDGDFQNHGKLKRGVPLNSMKIVREVQDKCLDDKSNVFQIVYEDKKDFPILYMVAKCDGERQAWLNAISDEATRSGAQFFAKYHPGVWTRKLGYYNCCDQRDRNAVGCKSDYYVPPPRPDTGPNNVEEYIAMYDFDSPEDRHLDLIQGEKYIILEKDSENWWFAKNRDGMHGYIPANYLKKNSGLEQYQWYYKECSRELSKRILMQNRKDGCFLVRDSISSKGAYSLSIFTTENTGTVRHYKILQNDSGRYYVSGTHVFDSIPELINYHKHNAGGIYSRLREPPPRGDRPSTAGFSQADAWELDERKLEIGAELGRGCFGVVYEGKYRWGTTIIRVAIKELNAAPESDEFIQEVKTMTKLLHTNIVQLYGVIVSDTNPKIVTELLVNGALDSYLKNNRSHFENNQDKLLDFTLQICCGMEFLNNHKILHRDLAARNCLVGENEVVKVADFGLAREVLMDCEYLMSVQSSFPFKWSPPEVFNFRKYTMKSDIWSFGILMWEIYSFGEVPYQGLKNQEITKFVAVENGRLSKPRSAPSPLYHIMMSCWEQNSEDRPDFTTIKQKLVNLSRREDYIPAGPDFY